MKVTIIKDNNNRVITIVKGVGEKLDFPTTEYITAHTILDHKNNYLGIYYKFNIFNSLYFESTVFNIDNVNPIDIINELNNIYVMKNSKFLKAYNEMLEHMKENDIVAFKNSVKEFFLYLRKELKKKLNPKIKNVEEYTAESIDTKIENDSKTLKDKVKGVRIIQL